MLTHNSSTISPLLGGFCPGAYVWGAFVLDPFITFLITTVDKFLLENSCQFPIDGR